MTFLEGINVKQFNVFVKPSLVRNIGGDKAMVAVCQV